MDDDLIFVIDGNDYLCPDIASFNMAERRVMFDLSGIVEEDFAQQDDETHDEKEVRVGKLTRHPGFIESLMHVAYARGNPDLKRARVQAVIDQTNYMEAIEKWAEREDDGSPPASESTSGPDGSSLIAPVGSSSSSGQGSTNGSAQPEETLSPTGIGRSDTSAMSDRTPNLSAV